MSRRTTHRILLGASALLFAAAAAAQTLYTTSIRTFAGGGGEKVVGNLYTVNLSDATAKLVAPILLGGNTAVGITGLAVHPATGVFYGITSPLSPVNPRSLVTIDVSTGAAELVGPLGASGSDIGFDPQGNLFVWLPGTSQLGAVDLSTAQVRPLGPPRPPGNSGGIAIDDKGIAWVTPNGAVGNLDRVDTATGVLTKGPTLIGAPFPSGIAAMTFTPSGLLLALNSNGGSPASVRLVTINTKTGQVNAIGSLPDDSDSLAFTSLGTHDIRAALATMSGRSLALSFLILGLAIAILAMLVVKLFKRKTGVRP
jgi:streptogramin lyase